MWPWGHLGVAYLLYSLYTRGRFGRSPRPEPALAVVVGSQFADLIDKPLAWGLGILPGGRTLAHSLAFAVVLIVVVYAVALVADRIETATAFVLAHLSHLLADLSPRLLLGYPFGSEFLFWPFLSGPAFGYSERVFEPPVSVERLVTPLTDPFVFALFELSLFGLAIGLWYVDGCPGLRYVRSPFRSGREE